MDKSIKDYWDNLKLEYKNKYDEPIFTSYENSKPFVERFRLYLEEILKENPNDIDAICALSTTMQELRFKNKSIKLLEDFINKYKADLNNEDKARIFTNLAFYHSGCDEEIEYLLEAEKLKSPFFETYKGLGQNYFSKYQFEDNGENLEKSLIAFEKSLELHNSYDMQLNCAATLFELKQYEKAKEIFEDLLIKYPNRMRLLLSSAYCDIYLGNKEKALIYLKQVKDGEDKNYYCNTDDIGDYQIYDAYYVLEEYEKFIKLAEKAILNYYQSDRYTYYYALWITKQYQKFDKVIENHKQQILSWIEEAKIDEDFKDDEDRQECIKSYQEDLEILSEIEHKIKNKNYKPSEKLELYPEYGCYLVDCIRHNF